MYLGVALVLLLVLYALFWSTPTDLLASLLLLYVLELRVVALLLFAEERVLELVLLYLGEVPLVLTLDLPRNATLELLLFLL